jgi:hypothetical protein
MQRVLSSAQLCDNLTDEQLMLSYAFIDAVEDVACYDVLGDILNDLVPQHDVWFEILLNLLYQGLLIEVSGGVTVPRCFWSVVADKVGVWYPEIGIYPPPDVDAYSLHPDFAARLDQMVKTMGEDAALLQVAHELAAKIESHQN